MAFTPSIYVSTQRIAAAPSGANTITAVNRDYTRLSIEGFKNKNTTGTPSDSGWYFQLTSNTNIFVAVGAYATSLRLFIEYFLPTFFRQPFYHGVVTIPDGALTGTVNTGQTHGPKAFIVYNGSNITFGVGVSPESETEAELSLSGGIVTATRHQVNSTGPGVLNLYFTVIDPK